jgi:site-specific DNA recombinase
MMRPCAIYGRYSADLQRDTSIEDQNRNCREFGARQSWPIVEEFVVADRAITGATLAGREGLQRLLNAAKKKPRPFECVLIDDTSRLARDLADALKIADQFKFYGVSIVFVSQGIDTAQQNSRQLLTLNGMVDEQYLVGLRDKVRRGQEGRALHGYTTGGRVYGYNNVPIEDPTRTGKYGRPAVQGVKLEIIPEQAMVVHRIFTMYAEGMGQGAIAKQLNVEDVRGPNGPWSRYTIHEMLRNERYRAVFVWGRTKKDRNPETGRKVSRDTPESQWRRVDVPEWRIVPEELWQAVQERRKKAQDSFHKLGGLTRTERGRSYLFSGVLACGACGGSMVICAGGGKRGYVKYGCHKHKQSGVCDNKLMIRQDRLEEQLLAAIEQRVLSPATLDYAVKRCEEELKKRLAEMERQGSITTLDSLKRQREDMQARRGRLIQAIEISGGDIPSLTHRLRDVEGEIKRLSEAIAIHRPVKLDMAVEGIRGNVMKSIMRLRETMYGGNVSRAREALAKHIGKLVLTPVTRDGRPVYRVSGSASFQTDMEKCRMQLVARDGIEPPTPAFSGLRSAVTGARAYRRWLRARPWGRRFFHVTAHFANLLFALLTQTESVARLPQPR